MNKAMILLDAIPNACDECKFESEMLNCGKPMCIATPSRREIIEDDSTRPSWCPIRPLPRKRKTDNVQNIYWEGYYDGWNGCVQFIKE